MSALRRVIAMSFAVAITAGLAALAPVTVSSTSSGNGAVTAIGPGCCK